MQLRDYQQRAHDMTLDWLSVNDGNVCVELATGSGKSLVIAHFCQWALQNYPETQILILSHVKEILEQNANKIKALWPNAPMGIFSAGMRRKQLGEPITLAGIQSVRNRAQEIGHIDLILVDECDLIGHKDEGGYRTLINELRVINPQLRVIGYTATPYRLGHGLITDKPAIFDEIIKPTSIEELIFKGYLSPLKSKNKSLGIDFTTIKKRGGEFIEGELAQAFDTNDNNVKVVQEVIAVAENEERKSWLFFCSGVEHAHHIKDILLSFGVSAACIDGTTSKNERERIIKAFQAGEITALTNCDVLTVGFDAPNIDLLVMLRPTMSPRLYVQIAGRGTRLKEHTDYCRVMDYAGNVARHGAITAVQAPPKKGEGKGNSEPPMKICDNCAELVHPSVKVCPECNTPFPEPEKPPMNLHNDDIMGIEGQDIYIDTWEWNKHISRASGKEMLKVSYYAEGFISTKIDEYFVVAHDGFAGQKARRQVAEIARQSGAIIDWDCEDLEQMAIDMSDSRSPLLINYKQDGKFYRVLERIWG